MIKGRILPRGRGEVNYLLTPAAFRGRLQKQINRGTSLRRRGEKNDSELSRSPFSRARRKEARKGGTAQSARRSGVTGHVVRRIFHSPEARLVFRALPSPKSGDKSQQQQAPFLGQSRTEQWSEGTQDALSSPL